MLPEIIGGLLLHPLFARAAANGNREPELRRITDIIDAILAKDTRPLDRARPLCKRVLGTCRNYALVACAILRQHKRPARLRVGFADYFTADFAEDHWVCVEALGGCSTRS
jgi:Transglutaminase-like superfamily